MNWVTRLLIQRWKAQNISEIRTCNSFLIAVRDTPDRMATLKLYRLRLHLGKLIPLFTSIKETTENNGEANKAVLTASLPLLIYMPYERNITMKERRSTY